MKLRYNTYCALIPLCGSLLAAFLFLIGVGRYRTVLLTSCYYLIEAISKYLGIKLNYIKPAFGPLVIVTVFLDYKYGQLLPIFANNNILVVLLIFIFSELVLNRYLITAIEKISNYNYFGSCPRCKYANKELTSKCSNCGYDAEDPKITIANRRISFVKTKTQNNQCNTVLSPKIPSKCLNMISLNDNEECIGCLRIFPERGIYINGNKTLVKYAIVTTENVILLDYHFYYSGWTFKQYINIKDIHSIIITKKHHHNKKVLILMLNSSEATYELFYSPFESAFKKLETIAICIQNINPEITFSTLST